MKTLLTRFMEKVSPVPVSGCWQDKKDDLWTVSNVIQENIIRGNCQVSNAQGDVRSKRKVTSIDRDSEIHDKLFALTKKFAELKGHNTLYAIA